MADDMADVRRMGVNPAGQPQPGPIAMGGGAPASFGQAKPRLPGNVVPAPVTGRVGQQITPPGFSGPTQPKPPMQPAPTPTPTPPPANPPTTPGITLPGAVAGPPAAAAPATSEDIDQMIRDFVSGQLANAGKANTAEEEALIRQQMQGELGQSLVNQRARMGRAGFGASGAMGAIEGDVRRAAEMDALDQILGLRRTEDQRSIENAQGAISVENQMRRGAADDALRRMALEALQAEMGLDAGVPDPAIEAALQKRANEGMYAGVPMEGAVAEDGKVKNVSTNREYETRTMADALSGNWVYGGNSFNVNGVTFKVYRDAQGNQYAVAA